MFEAAPTVGHGAAKEQKRAHERDGGGVVHLSAFFPMRHAVTLISALAPLLFSLLFLSEKKARSAFEIARLIEVPSALTFSVFGPHLRWCHFIVMW
ncbi:MAG: hypothetical protein ACRD36_08175 [Candidatus Acidiferrum sp.]